MRLLLVNANRFKQPWPVIPFGLCCVAAAVEAAGHQVTLLDLCFSPDPPAQLQEAITTFLPDVIGVGIRNIDNGTGCNTRFLLHDTLREIISPIKRHFSGPIVIGGAAVNISGREMLDYFDLPYALTGDGEEGMVLFLRQLAEGRTPSGIGGLIVRRNGSIVEENEPLRVGNLDRLVTAKPQRHLDLAPYRRYGSSLQIQTKRGCALRCSYCTYRRIEGESYRLRNPEHLAHEVATLVAETGINQIEIVDSIFNLPLDHCKEVLRALIALNMPLQLKAMGLSPAAVDEELVTLLKAAGFREVGLGVESASPVTLQSLGKGFGRKEILRAGELLHQGGIPVSWYLLVGAPGETSQTLADTFDTISAAASPWDLIIIGVSIRLYKGSDLAQAQQEILPACTEDNFLHPVTFIPEAITLDQIKAFSRFRALQHPNYYLYDEDEGDAGLSLALGSFLVRTFAPGQPIWRLYILLRRLQELLGIAPIKRALFRRQLRRSMSEEFCTSSLR